MRPPSPVLHRERVCSGVHDEHHRRRRVRSTLYLGGFLFLLLSSSHCSCGKEAVQVHLSCFQPPFFLFSACFDHQTCANIAGVRGIPQLSLAPRFYVSTCVFGWIWNKCDASTPAVCTTAGGVHLVQPLLLANKNNLPEVCMSRWHGQIW